MSVSYSLKDECLQNATLDDLPEFLCANKQDNQIGTGCTVVVCPEGATCSVDVRGGGPATRETDLLQPENMVEVVHAVVISGGSAFGLAASTGVMEELARRNIGFELCGAHVPIVTGACLFDLAYGQFGYPDADMGRKAVQAAFAHEPLSEGNVGAGCGATVGKMLDPAQAMKTGLGVYGLRCNGLVVIALVVVNALGTICDAQGTPIAGHRDSQGAIMDPLEPVLQSYASNGKYGSLSEEGAEKYPTGSACTNTTLGIVLTNASITKAQAKKVSSITHDAYARCIRPVHSSADGDTVFTMASGRVEVPFDFVAILATEAMQGAIICSATQAESAFGLPAALNTHLS